jgi:hypothetical protein
MPVLQTATASTAFTLPPGRMVLFHDQSIPDALADLSSIASHLCDCEHHDPGLVLLHRMLRDSLVYLTERVITERIPKTHQL